MIREAIRQEGMVAIGKVVFTSREHIIVLEARDKGLLGRKPPSMRALTPGVQLRKPEGQLKVHPQKSFGFGLIITGLYLLPLTVSNFMGPLLLGHLFDTVGRRTMITGNIRGRRHPL